MGETGAGETTLLLALLVACSFLAGAALSVDAWRRREARIRRLRHRLDAELAAESRAASVRPGELVLLSPDEPAVSRAARQSSSDEIRRHSAAGAGYVRLGASRRARPAHDAGSWRASARSWESQQDQ